MTDRSATPAIRTRYHGRTDTRPARVEARFYEMRASIECDYRLNAYENHRKAAIKFLNENLPLDANVATEALEWQGDHFWKLTWEETR